MGIITYWFITSAYPIDLELITGTKDTDPALEQLTNNEQALLHRCSDADKWLAFLQLWTAKEAVSKATGLGCGVAFHDIEVDCRPVVPDAGMVYRQPAITWMLICKP